MSSLSSSPPPINYNSGQRGFCAEVSERAHENINRCYHCRSCAGGCPFIEAMDYAPNAVIRLVQYGMAKEALESATIWTCVGCNTCASQCPMAIDMPAIMDALRQIAIERNVKIASPEVLKFHNEVLNSIERYGRTHKLEIMMRYKLNGGNLFGDMGVGLKMLAKRKLDLTPSRINNPEAIRPLFR